MRIRWQGPTWTFALGVFMLAVSFPAEGQSNHRSGAAPQAQRAPRPEASNSIDPVESSARLNELASTLRDRSSLLRVQAVEAIDGSLTIDAQKAEDLLQEALDDKDPLVAEAALRAIVRRGDEQLRLVSESDAETHPGETGELARVRVAAFHQDTAALRELMWNGDAAVQENAFQALASNDAAAAVEALKTELLDTASLHRLQTLELFIRSPYTSSPATLMPILKLAGEDEDALVKARARRVLAEQRAESKRNGEASSQMQTSGSVR